MLRGVVVLYFTSVIRFIQLIKPLNVSGLHYTGNNIVCDRHGVQCLEIMLMYVDDVMSVECLVSIIKMCLIIVEITA